MIEQNNALRLEDIYHPALHVLIEGLKAMDTPEARKILRDWDAARAIVDANFFGLVDQGLEQP